MPFKLPRISKKSPRIWPNSPILPLLLGIILVMEIVDPSSIWVVLLVGLGSALAISYSWARSLDKNLTLKREIRFGWTQVGDRLEERFTLENKGWAPGLWLEVEDRSNLPGYQVTRVTGIGAYADNTWRTAAECTMRGLYSLGPTCLHTSDPFGIFSINLENPASQSLLVMPPIVSLPLIQVAAGGKTGSGHPRSNAPEKTVTASHVRSYNPGDSLRLIHWPTTARKGSFYVRILDGTPTSNWVILLDLDSSVQVGEGRNSTLEHGIILAASLADQGLRLGRSVGLLVNGEELAWVPIRPGEEQKWEILRLLALAKSGNNSLDNLLRLLDPQISPTTSLIIITPSTQPGWHQELTHLLWRGVVPTILQLEPHSFAGEVDESGSIVMEPILTNLGIRAYHIPRSFLDRPEISPGKAGKWEWQISPTGRAIPVRRPSDLSWKTLA